MSKFKWQDTGGSMYRQAIHNWKRALVEIDRLNTIIEGYQDRDRELEELPKSIYEEIIDKREKPCIQKTI